MLSCRLWQRAARVCAPMARRFSQQSSSMRVFDRDLKRLHRDRAAIGADRNDHDMLRDEIADRLADRLADIKKKFPVAVDLGAGSGHVLRALKQRGGIERLIQVESSEEQVRRGAHLPLHRDAEHGDGGSANAIKVVNLVGDEENFPAGIEDGSVDLVISNLSMHWVNDLPGTFARVRRVLKPDGVFIASLLGGDTLQELRSAFALADMERLGGLSPHTSPFAGTADVGNLLTRAGFALPTVDQEKLTLKFPDAFSLMEALRGMGEQNCDLSRQPFVSRDVFLAAAAAYDALYRDDDGYVDATFNVIYLIGWSPDASQPKPLRRGSATKHLRDLDAEVAGAATVDSTSASLPAATAAASGANENKTP